jgi:hypothetical protein
MNATLFDLEPYSLERVANSLHATSLAEYSELFFATQAHRAGFSIWHPLGHAHKADIIIWKPPQRPLSVQVKVLSMEGKRWRGKLGRTPGGNQKRRNYCKYRIGDVDVLAFYLPSREKFALYHVSQTEAMEGYSLIWKEGDRLDNWSILDEI